MEGLHDFAGLQHFEYLLFIEDVHMDVLGFFLVLLASFLNARSQEGIGMVVMVRRIRGEGHEKLPFSAFVSGFFAQFPLCGVEWRLARVHDSGDEFIMCFA